MNQDALTNRALDQNPELNDMQRAFVQALATNGGNKEEAAIEAGYSKASAKQYAYELLKKPKVMKAFLDCCSIRLAEMAPGAIDTLADLSTNALSERVRMESAMNVLDRLGLKQAETLGDGSSGQINVLIDLSGERGG